MVLTLFNTPPNLIISSFINLQPNRDNNWFNTKEMLINYLRKKQTVL